MSKTVNLQVGNSLEVLKGFATDSIDSVVTDPPYGLSFMGKKWDYDVPSVELWKEVLRVLKPGGHLLSFSSARTYHRMTVNVEDAGFEIRDQIMWVYGSGFPKSHNIGKAYDKKMGNDRDVVGDNPNTRPNSHQSSNETWEKGFGGSDKITKGTSPYEGWGTALKPAHEPIVLARKPLSEKTIVDNVIKHGTGGINVDKSRIPFDKNNTDPATNPLYRQENGYKTNKGGEVGKGSITWTSGKNGVQPEGRFPANFIHDGSDELLDLFPNNWSDTARFFYCAKVSKAERNAGLEDKEKVKVYQNDYVDDTKVAGKFGHTRTPAQNYHPTVKPIKLMSYLVNLVTPVDGIVLDPFMGSGSTGMAAKQEGFHFVGIDLDEEYVKISQARIDNICST